MEGKGRVGSSSSTSSSFTAELFGSKDPSPPSSSSGIFSTIFPHPSKGSGRDGSNSKHGSQAQRRESLNAQEDRVEPCHLSSSLYYGGQDVYSRSTTNQTYPAVKNERRRSGEDDANGQNSQDVSRGNWWQGSLYY
ncbi:unnamed protein product [Arabidopsis lyrata]|uniref:Uncharacterized protein n=2 Tax=Arabidopsis TaxID=3701 RepID=D7MRS6_ARALL|nr:uncharacterized protein LOC9300696 [Arabidopsis lyrata subsp. lyrata]EFH40879.1 hypothetical protein ARALYDRAFT_496048 [Arabidopsis lyrata subsp. lyrata]CAE6249083.1 unnamed protein product [Arabidopsis arenosa]CAH8280206.1 unnamed protein product [Arabidopsis lyrata]|eukprot:XP_002864620.1 uncharacterized protein LOC9300696 [Arabidopsis lyrata subsp. lyrata]